MATIFGALGIQDLDRVFQAVDGQDVIYDAIDIYLGISQSDLLGQMRLFVAEQTEMYSERFKLPSSGRLQEVGLGVVPGVTKRYGSWDVAYPLKNFADGMASDDVSMAYMSARELQTHLDTALQSNIATMRHEMLYYIFNNTAKTWVDMLHGSLTVQPLANGDTVTYPPVQGSETPATDNHYLESGYAASAISDTNNPYVTMRDEIEEHFGTGTGGENIVALINKAQAAKTEDLSSFVEIPNINITPGDQTAIPNNYPPIPSTARLLGSIDGVWVAQWAWIPSSYIFATHYGFPAPLKMRVDPSDTGLARGLSLVRRNEEFPMHTTYWRNRFGMGVGNRLNGVMMELGTGGSYSIPSGYS